MSPDGKKLLEIKGQNCISCCGCCIVTDQTEFKVLSRPDVKIVGAISQAFPGRSQPNDFIMWVEEKLDVQLKALILTALLTIVSFNYFFNYF